MAIATPMLQARAIWLALPLLAALTAMAQASEVRQQGHVLRAGTAAAQNLPQSMRDQHGIPDDPRAAVINIAVQRTDAGVARNRGRGAADPGTRFRGTDLSSCTGCPPVR